MSDPAIRPIPNHPITERESVAIRIARNSRGGMQITVSGETWTVC